MSGTRAETGLAAWPVYSYFAAVMAFSTPFWFAGFVTDWEALPGIPVSALMVLVPGIVAFAFIAHADGRRRALSWLRRAWTRPRPKASRWLVAALLTPPAILFVTYLFMRLVGYEIPEPRSSAPGVVMLLALFFLPAVFEELGWSCFALVSLQQRMSALRASLLIGAVWALWHVIPLLQAGRSLVWIAWWCLTTVALRVLITWIFNNTSRSIVPVALFHASENASWQAFPVDGSHYEPSVHALVLWLVCALIIVRAGRTSLGKQCADDAGGSKTRGRATNDSP